MRAAARFGVPLSVLRGERNPNQAWTDHDGDMAVALVEYEASLCACGHPLWESMDPEHQRDWMVPPPSRCHACSALDEAAQAYTETISPRALRFQAVLRH